MKGMFLVDRAVFDHELFAEYPYCPRSAWLSLIARANWSEHGERGAGELSTTIRELAGAWHWSNDRVLRFLNGLETRQMVATRRTPRRTLITIINYRQYQDFFRNKRQQPNTLPNADTNTDANAHDSLLRARETQTQTDHSPSLRSGECAPSEKKKRERLRLSIEERHAERIAAEKQLAKGCQRVYLDEHDKQLIKEHWLAGGMTVGDMLDGIRKLDAHFHNKPLAFREQCDHRASMNGWVLKAVREDKTVAVRLETAENHKGKGDAYDKREQVRAKERAAVERAAEGGGTVLQLITGKQS